MKRFKEFLNENSLHVFDIDDTLFHTTAKIKVMHGTKEVASLSNSQYNDHVLEPGHHYDYSEFRSAHKFDTESKPVHRMLNKLKAVHQNVKAKGNGSRVIMNTAREDFDDKHRFLDTFRKHGVDIDDIHVHRAGNIAKEKGLTVAQSKNEVIRQHLNKGNYKTVHLYDDSKTNLKHFLKLKDEHPNVEFKAYHVKPDGSIKRHYEDE
jgi:glutaredoxin-related protein